MDNPGEKDICMFLPNAMVQDMEPEKQLPPDIMRLTVLMALAGYAPLDFGEEHKTHSELHFTPAKKETVDTMLSVFVKNGGWI